MKKFSVCDDTHIICGCGSVIRKQGLSNHLLTVKHKAFVQKYDAHTEQKFWCIWRNKYLLQQIYSYLRGNDMQTAFRTGNIQAFRYGLLFDFDGHTCPAHKERLLDILEGKRPQHEATEFLDDIL